MSHLLTRLVDRAMGLTPAIKPVRSPIFGAEPAAGLKQDSGRDAAGFAYADIITGAQAMHQTGTPTSAELSHTVSNRVEQEHSPSSLVQPVVKQVLHEFSDEQLAAQSPLQLQSDEPAVSSALKASPTRLTESVAVEPIPSAAVVFSVAPQTPRSSNSLSPRNEQGPKGVDMFSGRQALPESPEQTIVEAMLRPQDFSGPPVSSRNVVDKLPQQIINSRVEQPTIKVTIGRIEVRAMTTPPAQPPRQRNKTQPSLSLDDYLKQRAGGH